MRIRTVFLAAAVLFAAIPAFASHGWESRHWSRSCGTCPASITIHDSLGSLASPSIDWHDHLNKAVYGDPGNPNPANRSGWDSSAALTLTIVPAAWDLVTRANCPAVNGAVRVCNHSYGATGWSGVATVAINSANHIVWATAKMNDSYMSGQSEPWRRHVMCQEVGHDWGLGHTSENGTTQNTCMDYYKNAGFWDWTSTGPNQHDFDQILTQHHWGTSSVISVPLDSLSALRNPADDQLDQPWEWGTPVGWDRNGRADTFVRVFEADREDDELRIMTHVLWADSAEGGRDGSDGPRPGGRQPRQ